MWPYRGHFQLHIEILDIGSNWNLSHLVRNCKSQRLSFEVSKPELDTNVVRGQSEDSLSFLTYHTGPPKFVMY